MFSFHLPIGGRNFNFFEDICRLRAARRYWAKLMKEKYGAKDPRSLQFRFSTGGMGGGLTAEQPLNNIARETIYAMAAIFSGTRSLNLACFDEVYAIPSDLAIRTSLRVQQILALRDGGCGRGRSAGGFVLRGGADRRDGGEDRRDDRRRSRATGGS